MMVSTPKKVKNTGVTFLLNEPGMGEMERAGLAGLCLSLSAIKLWKKWKDVFPLPSEIDGKLTDVVNRIKNIEDQGFPVVEKGKGVRLEWGTEVGTEKAALDAIVQWAWQVHDGVFFLPGIHRKREHLDCYYLRLHAHNGMMATFFQFPTTIPKFEGQERRVERFDEEKSFAVSYRRIKTDAKLPQWSNVPSGGICTNKIPPAKNSWIYPGAEPRFNNSPQKVKYETGWRGEAKFSYLMLFVPIACHYIKLPNTNGDNWAYIVSSIRNLEWSAQGDLKQFLRRNTVKDGNWPFFGEVSGLEDATLRYMVRNRDYQSTTVVMGKSDFYHDFQKTRKNLYRDLAKGKDAKAISNQYDVFNRIFPAGRTIKPTRPPTVDESGEKGSHFIDLPSCRERITANVLSDRVWYSELAYIPFWQVDRMNNQRKKVGQTGLASVGLHLPWKSGNPEKESISPERLWFLKLQHLERRGIMEIAEENTMWKNPTEKDIFKAFREAFRRLLNKEDEALKRGGSRDLLKRWDNTLNRWHRRLLHAKTKPLLSSVVHELLAEAARSPTQKNEEVFGSPSPVFLIKKGKDEDVASYRQRNEKFHSEFRRMISDAGEWKNIRDLALLAMATFSDARFSDARFSDARLKSDKTEKNSAA